MRVSMQMSYPGAQTSMRETGNKSLRARPGCDRRARKSSGTGGINPCWQCRVAIGIDRNAFVKNTAGTKKQRPSQTRT